MPANFSSARLSFSLCSVWAAFLALALVANLAFFPSYFLALRIAGVSLTDFLYLTIFLPALTASAFFLTLASLPACFLAAATSGRRNSAFLSWAAARRTFSALRALNAFFFASADLGTGFSAALAAAFLVSM